jgi:hypothetical protein
MDIAYVRTSRSDEHIENQIDAIRKVVPDAKFFIDAGISGAISADKRKGFQDMLQYIEENKPNELYVYEISRLGRMMYDTLETVNILEEKYGVRVRSVSPKEVRLGRPERKINWVKVKELRSPDKHGRRVPYTVISRILDVPYPTLMAYKKDRNDLD